MHCLLYRAVVQTHLSQAKDSKQEAATSHRAASWAAGKGACLLRAGSKLPCISTSMSAAADYALTGFHSSKGALKHQERP